MNCQSLGVLLMVTCGQVALAQQPAGEPLHNLLISPEVLMGHRAEIGLTSEQVDQIRTRLEKAAAEARQVQERANAAMGRLAELLSVEEVDEEAALNQLDEFLEIEKEQKRLHLRLMIQMRNQLTAEQRRVATKIGQSATSRQGLEQRLKGKLARIEKEVQSRAAAGQPPFAAVGLMQKFPELMQSGQVREAEMLLDRVITELGLDKADHGDHSLPAGRLPIKLAEKLAQLQQRAQSMQQNGDDVSQIQALLQQLGPLLQQGKTKDAEKLIEQAWTMTGKKTGEQEAAPQEESNQGQQGEGGGVGRTSPEAVRAAYTALKKDDVAWRKIPWKTCLLEGLQASRAQSKPILLWVFIDRPIDDERC